MQNRQINTTENEIIATIGLAADEIAERQNIGVQMAIMEIAARITDKVIAHLTGEERFPDEEMKLFEEIIKECKNTSGGGSNCPESVEEDKEDGNV